MAVSFNIKTPETKRIVCYHCGTPQDVSRRAQTVTCRKCSKGLQISDIKVKAYDARRKIQTTGDVIIERKGQIVADAVDCGGLVVQGQLKVKNAVTVRGPAVIGANTSVTGDLRAHQLAVGSGATLEGYYCVGKDDMVPPPPPAEVPP
jgi:cytoskeletal protein CcmA (bactofilin family)